ncbi:unnamed protein product [Caenorhabditis angaria]|uniref:Uncharacterized protein n=1 Tax=Caenorhabditis angaria TaxID=860376 RepID=A0A9P1IJ33_9PELO|nr:unnamed protein product [Caenorhabditis angaria]
MTQLSPNTNAFQHPENHQYFVQEPLGKRPFPVEFEYDMEYVPRSKRRFDKISSCLENFSISNDTPNSIPLDSSSEDDEMEEIFEPIQSTSSPSSEEPFIIEPEDDEPATAKKIRLDESLQRYLRNAREYDDLMFLPKKEALRGDEITLWQPKILISPRNDFNMTGRITEIDEEEEERVENEIKDRIIENEGMLDEDLPIQNCGIVELDEDVSEPSSWNSSPIPSPPSSQIVELDEESRDTILTTPTSLTNGSVSDDYLEDMEFD